MKANRRAGGQARGGHPQREEGAVHVLEAIIFAILILASIAFVVTYEVPTSQRQQEQADLEVLLGDALDLLASRAAPAAPDVYRDALEQYVMEAISGNPANLTAFLDAVLPPGVQYNLHLDNGYARFPVYVDGTPPRESAAKSRLFVPKLSHTFLEPDVRYQHSELPMSVYALPVSKSVLVEDEGEAIEFYVNGTEWDPATKTNVPFTVRAFHTTAWVSNAGLVKHPSVSLVLNPAPGDPSRSPLRYVPATDLSFVDLASPFGDGYRYTFALQVRETAGQVVPVGTRLTAHLPRGWNVSDEQQDAMRADNAGWWTNVRVEGDLFVGWNLTAEVATAFQAGRGVWFNHTADYQFLVDTSANHHLHAEYFLSNGTQGRTEVVVENPSASPVGKLGRRVWASLPRPSADATQGLWGLTFTNTATNVTVHEAGIRVVSGAPMFLGVDPSPERTRNDPDTAPGARIPTADWSAPGPSRLRWKPAAPLPVDQGNALDLMAPVRIAPGGSAAYRNLDYIRVPLHFDAEWNLTPHSPVWDGMPWTWSDNLTRHGGPAVHKDFVIPYDDWPALGYPSDLGVTYWFEARTPWQGGILLGNRTFSVMTDQFLSSTFSDYQGAAQQSTIAITNAVGDAKRQFALGDRVYVRNDFSALFTKLGQLEQAAPGTISDAVNVLSEVYTPAGAPMHRAAQLYRETGAVSSSVVGPVARLATVDVDGDGLLDVLAGGLQQNVYALDGNDGSKFWTLNTGGGHEAGFALGDLDGDGVQELITGSRDNKVYAIRKDPAVHAAQRVMWSAAPTSPAAPSAGFDVNDVDVLDIDGDGTLEVLAVTGEDTKPAHVFALDGETGAVVWFHRNLYDAVSGVDITFTTVAGGVLNGQPVVFAGSKDDRVYGFDARTGALLWVHAMPPKGGGPTAGDVVSMAVADLDGDGNTDLVVGQRDGAVWAFNGDKATTDTHLLLWGGTTTIEDLEIVDEWRQFWVGAPLRFRVTTDGWLTYAWVTPDNAEPGPYVAIDFLDRDRGFVVTGTGHVYRTTTGGVTGADWAAFAHLGLDLDSELLAAQRVTGMKWVSDDEGWVIADHGRAYHYADHDADPVTAPTWVARDPPTCFPGDPPGCLRVLSLRDLDVLPSGDVVFAGYTNEVAPTNDDRGVVLRWSAATSSWIREYVAPVGRLLYGVDMLDDLEGWAVGAEAHIAHTRDGWTTVDVQTTNQAYGDVLHDVEMASPTAGFASGRDGGMFRLVNGGDQWTRLAHELPANVNMQTVATHADGFAWFGGELGHMAAAHSYARASTLEFVTIPMGGALSPAQVTVEIHDREGHTLDNFNYPMSAVDWYASLDGGARWTKLALQGAIDTTGYKDYVHKATVPCGGCDTLTLRAVLRTQSNPDTGIENDDFTPHLVRLTKVDVKDGAATLASFAGWNLVGGSSTITRGGTQTVYEGDVIQGSLSTARREPGDGAAGSVVGARMAKLWSTQVFATAAAPLARPMPFLDASRDWNGDGHPDVVVAAATTGGSWNGLDLLLLNGRNGTILDRFRATTSTDPGYPTSMFVTDTDGDGDGDVVLGTLRSHNQQSHLEIMARMGDPPALARKANLQTGVSATQDLLLDVADAGDNNRDGWRDVVDGDVTGNVEVADLKPVQTFVWSTRPSEIQGRVTFSYPVGMQSLYGTYFVVSSLEFQVTQGGATHTQVSRLVEYFHVAPPGGDVPRPPFYDLELVAWIPEV